MHCVSIVLGHTLDKTIVFGYLEGKIDVNLSAKWQVLSRGQLVAGSIVARNSWNMNKIIQ